MGLFGFGKDKEEKKSCCCGSHTEVEAKAEHVASAVDESSAHDSSCCCCKGSQDTDKERGNGICCIKVLGAGCRSCHEMFENTRKAVDELGLGIEVGYSTDMKEIMGYGAISMPLLVVNEKVVSMGKVLKPAEIIKLFGKLGY